MLLILLKKQLTIIFILFIIFSSFSQTKKDKLKKMSFSELINKMTENKDSIFNLKNTLVIFNKTESQKYDYSQYRLFEKPYPSDTTHIYKKINFENVHFKKFPSFPSPAFVNFSFHKSVNIKESYNISFFNCQFIDKFFSLNSKNSEETKNYRWLYDCSFSSEVGIYESTNQASLGIDNCKFDYFGNNDYSNVWKKHLFNLDFHSNSGVLSFINNRFINDNTTFVIELSKLNDLFFQDNIIKSKYWNILSFNDIKQLSFMKNDIDTDLLYKIDKLKPEYNIQWPITNKKIIPTLYLFYNQKDITPSNKVFDSIYDNQRVKDELLYKLNLTLLSKYHSYFKELHDRQSANEVYVKIKNLETNRLEYLFDKNKTFNNYFELIINRFLKDISNYGTSLSKIVQIAFKIILFFAFLFLFSKNSWNIIKENSLNKKINQAISYFATENSLKNIENIRQNKVLKIQILRNKKNVPKVFMFFSLMLIKFKTMLSNFKLYLINYPDLTKKSWKELSSFKKGIYNITFLVGIFIYASLILFTILLNSLTLSINSFTTLGFGEIPIKGIGRYLAIIEGFIGWIFLTIFSVTLISQILS